MNLKQCLKAIRWFAIAPLRRCRYLFNSQLREAAAGMHWSTEVLGMGTFLGSRSVVFGRGTRLTLSRKGALEIADGAWIGDNCELSPGELIQIGAHTSLQNHTIILGDVSIGAGCACGPGLYISSAWHHFDDVPFEPIRWQDARAMRGAVCTPVSRKIEIGDDCWLGINVVVAPGVVIGRGCVIGANSVVTRNLPPYSVAVGAPARVIRQRLVFTPPRFLRACLADHLPYFYSGFRQWGDRVNSLESALDRSGWRTEGSFCIAISLENGASIRLQVDAYVPGMLQHGSQKMLVPAGKSVLHLKTECMHSGFLEFEWRASRSGHLSGLVVVAVEQDA